MVGLANGAVQRGDIDAEVLQQIVQWLRQRRDVVERRIRKLEKEKPAGAR